MNKYRGQKIQKTSFLDKAFMKTLAGAVRFGTTLLVENVEKLDPVLNPIVSRDLIVSFSFIIMYKVLIHCTHCSSLTVEQGDPAHWWPLISEVSQSQLSAFVNLLPFIFLTLHSLFIILRIGTEDVDYSPKFNIILTTKNPAVKLTPDICSRVTLINFTVTPAGLQSQSLSKILECEKPEIEKQR